MDERLNEAARKGDIEALYALIQENRHVLKGIDEEHFVDTPLHIAASEGQIEFALEMMNLKPSFARKLNQHGFSPMHVALEKKKTQLVLRLLKADEGLGRVKGREGVTPFLYAAKEGDVDLLTKFLEACPECIQDVTVQGNTALHIALKERKMEAFRFLLQWLLKNRHRDGVRWEKEIVNLGDNEGNTVLHITAKLEEYKAAQLLVGNPFLHVDMKAENLEGLTAMEIIQSENKRQVKENGDKRTGFIEPYAMLLERLKVNMDRIRKAMSGDEINALLVVIALAITATYQASLSPPGGVWPPPADNSTSKSTSNSNSNVAHINLIGGYFRVYRDYFVVHMHDPGTTVMKPFPNYFSFWLNNTATLWTAIFIAAWLLAKGPNSILLLPLYFLGGCYHISMKVLSPSTAWSIINIACSCTLSVFPFLLHLINFLKTIMPIFSITGPSQRREFLMKLRRKCHDGGDSSTTIEL